MGLWEGPWRVPPCRDLLLSPSGRSPICRATRTGRCPVCRLPPDEAENSYRLILSRWEVWLPIYWVGSGGWPALLRQRVDDPEKGTHSTEHIDAGRWHLVQRPVATIPDRLRHVGVSAAETPERLRRVDSVADVDYQCAIVSEFFSSLGRETIGIPGIRVEHVAIRDRLLEHLLKDAAAHDQAFRLVSPGETSPYPGQVSLGHRAEP